MIDLAQKNPRLVRILLWATTIVLIVGLLITYIFLSQQNMRVKQMQAVKEYWTATFGCTVWEENDNGILVEVSYPLSSDTLEGLEILRQGGMEALCNYRFGEEQGPAEWVRMKAIIEAADDTWTNYELASSEAWQAARDFLLHGTPPNFDYYTIIDFTNGISSFAVTYLHAGGANCYDIRKIISGSYGRPAN